jgi:hypothetical protein
MRLRGYFHANTQIVHDAVSCEFFRQRFLSAALRLMTAQKMLPMPDDYFSGQKEAHQPQSHARASRNRPDL